MVRQLRLPYTACTITINSHSAPSRFFHSSVHEHFLIFLKLPASLDHTNQHSILLAIRTPVLWPSGLLLQHTCKNLREKFYRKNSTCKALRAKILAYLVKFVCPRALSMPEGQTITPTPGPSTPKIYVQKSVSMENSTCKVLRAKTFTYWQNLSVLVLSRC